MAEQRNRKIRKAVAAVLMALAASAGATQSSAKARSGGESFPIVELRQYTLKDGQRDVLIELFEREFIESQETLGIKVIGTFRDLDRPNHFVWLRGFPNMAKRAEALNTFYFGPVWQANRTAANATMVDSDNVLLLHAPRGGEFIASGKRPALGESAPSGLVVATIYYLNVPPAEVLPTFEAQVKPRLEKAGAPLLAWLVPEPAPNNFPQLPVREGERVLVWFTRFDNEADHAAHAAALNEAAVPIAKWMSRTPEVLRLQPTARSLFRGAGIEGRINGSASTESADGRHDFDFLHGRWTVAHRLLKARGTGSKEWAQYAGTADTRPLLGGLCNVEEHRISGRDSGIALRCYDGAAKRWAIYWVGERNGLLEPPVYGGFQGTEGVFVGDDTYNGRPIKVRFFWHKLTSNSARWEQAFSFDSGTTWETNWIMDFKRRK